eukprot:TRINITY_DN3248_c0_g2_i1.p1 TRINITY_DN3248_c0_g2~~TRINITY_DN3248_c0_g2_i1.p1  ORF type:complete len:297 (-),score=61.23 TRINITY_DN3248_c0_g2_i1:501-1391(-)
MNVNYKEDFDEISRYKQSIMQENQTVRELKRDNENIKDINESMKRDVDSIHRANTILNKECEKLKQENEKIRYEYRRLQIDYENLKDDKERLKEELMANFLNKKKDFQDQVELCKQQMKELKQSEGESCKKIKREVIQLSEQLNESEQKRLKAECELQKIIAELKAQDIYKERMRTMEKEIKVVREKKKELSTKCKSSHAYESNELQLVRTIDEILGAGRVQSLIPDINPTANQKSNLLKILFNKLVDVNAEYKKMMRFKETSDNAAISELTRRNNKVEVQLEAIHREYEYLCTKR